MSTVDPNIVRIAERRLHLATDDEIQRLGLSDRSIRRHLQDRQLHRVLPGVLSTSGGPYSVQQWELALCLSIVEAVLSHESAAAFWRLRRAPKDRVEITVPHGVKVRKRTAVVHRSNCMPDHHVVELIDGARVTSVPRTVFDLGGVLDESSHVSVIEDARNRRLCTDDELGEVYADLCGRGRRGSAAWERLVEITERVVRPTMSELELELSDALVAHGLPRPIQQHPIALPSGRVAHLDLAYLDTRLDIEVDHSEWHATASAVERDKHRDLGLALLGWERLRFTERDVERRLRYCVATVARVIDVRHHRPEPPAA
jgi:very-short-patch-repair endonuclease